MNPYLSGLLTPEVDLETGQRDILLSKLVGPNANSQFGIDHNFSSINSIDDYRRHVPLVDYEAVRPWVDRLCAGEENVLTSGKVLAFVQTSGSLSKPKLIPVTTDLMRQKVGVFAAFWESVYQDYPRIRHGKLVSNFADASEPRLAESGLKIYSEAAFWAKRGRGLHTLDRWPLPSEVRRINDPEIRSYACARILLQEDMNCIMCLNPSTLLYFCRIIHEHLPSLVAGLECGDWDAERNSKYDLLRLPEHDGLNSYLRVDKAAAERLRQFDVSGDTPELKSLWPSLDLIICWQSKVVQPYFKQLAAYTRGVASRDYISAASESMVAVPIQDSKSGGVLAHTAHFFEFIPEHLVDLPQPETRLAWQLELGQRYEVVVSTGGGLYRYRMGDCVQVNGFHGAIPDIEFLYRVGKTSSITGEKLTEHQVIQAAKKATDDCHYGPEEFLCFPCSGEVPHYAVAMDCDQEEISDEQLKPWGLAFEQHLSVVNTEYSDKCHSGRLGSIKLYRADTGHLRDVRFKNRAAGVSEEQVKCEVLTSTLDLHETRLTLKALR